jgi:DNA-binding CsgD family transcriptional regulator
LAYFAELTERGEQVLELIAHGHTNQQIAVVLCISINTVQNHVKQILKKLGVHNRGEAACKYLLCKLAGGGRVKNSWNQLYTVKFGIDIVMAYKHYF